MRHAVLLALMLAAPALRAQTGDDLFAVRKNIALFGQIYEALASQYVDRVDAERMMRTGIASMMGELDPYTVFFDEATTAAGRLQQGRDVGGVGVVAAQAGGRLVVSAVLDASAAEAQGVRPGDALVSIAGRPAAALTAAAAAALLRGEPGSTVAVEVEREAASGPPTVLRFQLVRAEEPTDRVAFSGFIGSPADGVAYIRLSDFLGPASGQIRSAVEVLQGQGTVRALVLDLRGNPGGLLNEAVDVSGLFLPQGTLVTATRGRAAGMAAVYRTTAAPLLPDTPVAVLVDRHSASASEIVAGALQDWDRGVVVGETTFGKGLVQVVRPMPYGTALKLTVSRYTTPVGREIQRLTYAQGTEATAVAEGDRRAFRTAAGRAVRSGGGIEPDVPVDLGEPSALEAALVREAAFLRFANRYAAEHPDVGADFRVTDAVWADFRRTIDGVDYETPAELAVDALARDLAAAGTEAPAETAALRRVAERDKARDAERHQARLRARLRQEILARAVGQRGLAEAALADDAVLAAARALLLDPSRYAQTLGRR
ncbi:MAG TPA: S41 family peptidase [Rubricoccaceae bacterium]|jgi:carboxyl-terminal processing protease